MNEYEWHTARSTSMQLPLAVKNIQRQIFTGICIEFRS